MRRSRLRALERFVACIRGDFVDKEPIEIQMTSTSRIAPTLRSCVAFQGLAAWKRGERECLGVRATCCRSTATVVAVQYPLAVANRSSQRLLGVRAQAHLRTCWSSHTQTLALFPLCDGCTATVNGPPVARTLCWRRFHSLGLGKQQHICSRRAWAHHRR